MHPTIQQVTDAIAKRSADTRQTYLQQMQAQENQKPNRDALSCGNLAHAVAPFESAEKQQILDRQRANVAIVTAYNDMLSAHQPYQHYPQMIKQTLFALGHSAQVAGGVPAMCDGVTQGQVGMEMSLFSRDVIAMATSVSLSHNIFDGTLLLGICDKIAPGQLMGALAYGHLPTAFVPSGPMSTGISNDEKTKVRQAYAAGEVGKDALLASECSAYHSHGTCTFYGTANTNQLVFEAMGLMLPGSAFVHPDDPLRRALTDEISQHIPRVSRQGDEYRPLYRTLDEKSLVNGLVALLSSGGSTNHTIHMIAIARAAGLILTWEDIDALSDVVPLLVNIYPNGSDDINAFQEKGGTPRLLFQLNRQGLLHMDAVPVYGQMIDYLKSPQLDDNDQLSFVEQSELPPSNVIATSESPFSAKGGLRVMTGSLGRGVMKVSAVAESDRKIEAPARVFDHQDDVVQAYEDGLLNSDAIIVVRFNGPSMNGMPELHKLMPILGNLMKKGHRVALVTDGRLSGASGKVPSVLHVTPEAAKGGALAKLKDGDPVVVDGENGSLECLTDLSSRKPVETPNLGYDRGYGRDYFSLFRQTVGPADQGASVLFPGDIK
ncbi:phosphogluconate dehydratase [Reinekea blandensis]|uniref:Phosphogluconate dehydratase n=1 Tax=Reinekea blandensis MED297 TaxID=314283 RepID=A4BHF9_9GAMM|nr:phosphogluconate dehydratase [Reinekea blandensis]EAR08507.1 phosphogluconate dehydratase [Reinekea sp. MED297] [Reinekea blandensis MED297]